MRILPALLLSLICVTAQVAFAQVSTDTHALDALQPPPPPPPAKKSAARPAAKRPSHAHGHSTATQPLVKAAPTLPPAPPANPVIAPPPLVLPTHAPPPPPPIPVKPDAPGAVISIPGGTRVTFGPGISDLNPATLAAIRLIAAEATANPSLIIGVTAWAPGSPDDPSTPRRLSLDRALAARAVLINAGIVSERIRTVAKGMTDIGTAPADRVDIIKMPPVTAKP